MTDEFIDSNLRIQLHRLAALRGLPISEGSAADVEQTVRARVDSPSGRRRSRSVAVIAASLGIVVALVALALVSRSDPPSRVRAGAGPAPTAESGVKVLDPGPLSPRSDAAVAWTGASLFVFGGSSLDRGRQLNDGATYDPKTNRWTLLSKSPFPPSYAAPVVVSTPDQIVVARGEVVAAWHYRTNTWTRLENAPGRVKDLTWAGGPLLSASANGSLNPRTGQWSPLTTRPSGLGYSRVVWTGSELIALGQGEAGAPPTAAYSTETDRWRELPKPPNLIGLAIAAAYDGKRVVVVDYELHAAAYSPVSDQWSALPDVPAAFYEWQPELLATSSTMAAFMGNAVVFRTEDGVWIPVSYSALALEVGRAPNDAPGVALEGPGDALLVFGWGSAANKLVRIQPARVLSAVTSVPVRSASIHLGDGFRYIDGLVTRSANGQSEGVGALIEGPGGRCVVASNTGPGAVRSKAGPWTRTGDQGWQRELRGQERLTIKCGSPDAAERILDRIAISAR